MAFFLTVISFIFKTWSEKVGVPWGAIKPHLLNVMSKAREQWPQLLEDLSMIEEHQEALKQHWQQLHGDFVI
ncbi:hypothetical protein BCV08_08420 [Vibrio breoganii]|nr:hypothetical protein A1QE_07195 [Vibrio breoganii ZF-55]PMG01520.1 hypothetical protein BCV08_08420 [Vibrio breoganii]PMK37611.1 hypothetical protein BCU00_04050 [Vibrio breoganii]